jgi:hypothetical protein
LAASAAVWIGLLFVPTVAAVAAMIANITISESTMPVMTSSRFCRMRLRRPSAVGSWLSWAASPCSSFSRTASARWADCQNRRYGDSVVPRTPTISCQ